MNFMDWHSTINVTPGSTTYIVPLLPTAALLPGSLQTSPEIETVNQSTTSQIPLTLIVAHDPMIIGTSQSFTGTGTPGENVALTLTGPGKYTTGVVFQASVGADGRWVYTWNPGYSVLSGSYTVVVTDTQKTSSARDEFTVIGGGLVSVTTDMYSYSRGSTVLFSGQCTTGSQHVMLTLYGPGLYASGANLGTQSVNADNSWSFPFLISQSMPIGTYSISVTDEQRTSSASAGFTILQ